VQGNTSAHHIIFITTLEMPIHVSVYKAEDNRLVTYQSLVMTLTIRDGLFVGTAVPDLPEYTAGFPVLVSLFFDRLNPVVRNVHCKAIVKAVTTIFVLGCQSRHATDFLSDCHGMRIHLMDELVGHGQIADCIVIFMPIEVITIIGEGLAQSMTVVEHRRYTVETESVKMKFL